MNEYARSRVAYALERKSDEKDGIVRGFVTEGKSRTQQQFKEETDINTIVRRFGLTGTVPGAARMPQYGDFTGVSDYQSAMNSVLQAQEEFMKLPAALRKEFDNDPQQLLQFVSDDANRARAEELGLVPKKPTPEAPPEGGTSGST